MWRFYKWRVIYNTDKIRAFWKPCLKSWEILFSLSLCLFKKKFCQMCEKSEFLWRERPVLYHVMPFRSSNYTNFSNYIWYGISKKRHVYLLKLPTIESVNKKKSKYQAHSSKFFEFHVAMHMDGCTHEQLLFVWWTKATLFCTQYHFFCNHPKPYCSTMCIKFFL